MLTAKEASDELARTCLAEPVQVIGSKFVLYKENRELSRDQKIQLTK
jgi:RNA-binding protein